MTSASALQIRPARGRAERASALALRHRVFCGEQGVSEAEESDGRDGQALHLVAISGTDVVGTCRLLFDGETAKLGRMAVERTRRGRGLGRALLRAAEQEARAAGARRVALHAQTGALGLYQRGGYAARGPTFMEAGIEHVAMEKRLA
jgi:predicted GNAT family N-acyltransferase